MSWGLMWLLRWQLCVCVCVCVSTCACGFVHVLEFVLQVYQSGWSETLMTNLLYLSTGERVREEQREMMVKKAGMCAGVWVSDDGGPWYISVACCLSALHQMKIEWYDGYRGGCEYEASFSHIKCSWRLGSQLKIMDAGQRSTYQGRVLVSNLLLLAPA